MDLNDKNFFLYDFYSQYNLYRELIAHVKRIPYSVKNVSQIFVITNNKER